MYGVFSTRRVFDPVMAIVKVEDFDNATRLLAQTTLRNTLGTKNLGDILAERESISEAMKSLLDHVGSAFFSTAR